MVWDQIPDYGSLPLLGESLCVSPVVMTPGRSRDEKVVWGGGPRRLGRGPLSSPTNRE